MVYMVDLSIFKFAAATISLLYPSPSFCQTMRKCRSSPYAEDRMCSQEAAMIYYLYRDNNIEFYCIDIQIL